MRPQRMARLVQCLEGRRVGVSLADGSRIDDCELVSAPHGAALSVWLYSNGTDLFVPLVEVIDLWEVVPSASSHLT